jgi:hypothetical protein
MRSFRTARLLVLPALVVPLLLGIVVPSGTAWAKGAKAVSCVTLMGQAGGTWSLEGCNQPAITGGNTTGISQPFPTAHVGSGSLTITWNPEGEAYMGGPAGTTTFSYSAMQLTGPKDKCMGIPTEWELQGWVTGNTVSPKVKGKLKLFACVGPLGVLSSQRKSVKL